MEIREMLPDDYEPVRALWMATEGVGLDASDEREPLVAFLKRNPGLSMVACLDGANNHPPIIAAVICGHDGRRGYISHLAVAETYRGHGIGRLLVDACLARLASHGVLKCNIRVFAHNDEAAVFWQRLGFAHRADLMLWQRSTG